MTAACQKQGGSTNIKFSTESTRKEKQPINYPITNMNYYKTPIVLLFLTLTSCFTEKTVTKKWKIDKYKITLTRAIGITGPTYYYYRLDKKNFFSAIFFRARIVYPFENPDSCFVNFDTANKRYNFDICKNKPEILSGF
jgi:hypothetical protein